MDSTSELDESLVAKAQGGDMDALDALVRRHQSWVFNLAFPEDSLPDGGGAVPRELFRDILTSIERLRLATLLSG